MSPSQEFLQSQILDNPGRFDRQDCPDLWPVDVRSVLGQADPVTGKLADGIVRRESWIKPYAETW